MELITEQTQCDIKQLICAGGSSILTMKVAMAFLFLVCISLIHALHVGSDSEDTQVDKDPVKSTAEEEPTTEAATADPRENLEIEIIGVYNHEKEKTYVLEHEGSSSKTVQSDNTEPAA